MLYVENAVIIITLTSKVEENMASSYLYFFPLPSWDVFLKNAWNKV